MRVFAIMLCLAIFGAGATIFWIGFSVEPRLSSIEETDGTTSLPTAGHAIGTAPNALLNPPTSGYEIQVEQAAEN